MSGAIRGGDERMNGSPENRNSDQESENANHYRTGEQPSMKSFDISLTVWLVIIQFSCNFN